MRPALLAGLATIAMLAPTPKANAAELQVSYLVDARALRAMVVVRDVLRFKLYSDASCRTPLHVEKVAALHVAVSPTALRPAAWPERPAGARRAARLDARLLGAPRRSPVYLIVRGPGVIPVGGSCQPQTNGL